MSAADLPKTTLNKDFQKKRQDNYQKDVEREKMEKEKERDREEKEKLQREIDEMIKQLSKLATVPPSSSSTLQVNKKTHNYAYVLPKILFVLDSMYRF